VLHGSNMVINYYIMNRTHDTILMHLHTTYEEDDRRMNQEIYQA